MRRVLFYPEAPRPANKVYHALKELGVRWTTDPEVAKRGFFWTYETKTKAFAYPEGTDLLNLGGMDVSKEAVDLCNRVTFGRGLNVDPRKVKGSHIRKSSLQCDWNYRPRIVECPCDPEPGTVTQRIVGDPHFARRAYIFGEEVVFLFTKHLDPKTWKPKAIEWYDSGYIGLPHWEDDVPDLVRFARLFDVQYAELDYVIDGGQILVLDVNNVAGTMAGKELVSDYGKFWDAYKRNLERLIWH